MKLVLNKENTEKPERPLIVLNEYCQVFCGLKHGLPAFSDNIDDAKSLFETLKSTWKSNRCTNPKYESPK